MSRLLGRLAFALLFLILVATLVALSRANFSEGTTGKPYLLSLPDLSSPRATLQTLIDNGNIAERAIFANGVPWLPSPEMLRMMDTVNVSELPVSRRELGAALAAAQLKDVIDHVALPPMSEIPDAAAVNEQKITEWRLPGTAIVLAKVATGPGAGQFQFAPQTVALAGDLSDAVMDTPHRPGQRADIYAEFRYMPGPMVPRAAITALPDSLRFPVLGQALWQWIGLVLLLVINAACMLHMLEWGVRHDAAATGPLRRYGQPAAAFGIIVLSVFTLIQVDFGLKIWGRTLEVVQFLLQLTAIAAAAWLVISLILRVSELISSQFTLRDSTLDAQLVRVTSMLLAIGVAIGAVFFAADFVGVPIGPLLAGLGIGGLAVALAVRPTLENVIGGLTLFADRPARVGEFCAFGSQSGTVEEIGLRTTKIRGTDDTVVTIANAELAQTRIQNFSRRRKFQFSLDLRLGYDTAMEQFQQISAGIRSLLEDHEKVIDGSERVHVIGLGEYAIELQIRAYIDVTANADFLVVQEELSLGILDAVRRAGVGIAYPARTNYLARHDRPAGATPSPDEPETAPAAPPLPLPQ